MDEKYLPQEILVRASQVRWGRKSKLRFHPAVHPHSRNPASGAEPESHRKNRGISPDRDYPRHRSLDVRSFLWLQFVQNPPAPFAPAYLRASQHLLSSTQRPAPQPESWRRYPRAPMVALLALAPDCGNRFGLRKSTGGAHRADLLQKALRFPSSSFIRVIFQIFREPLARFLEIVFRQIALRRDHVPNGGLVFVSVRRGQCFGPRFGIIRKIHVANSE